MARARNLKPGFFTNGDLLECQPLARILFAGLWCEADRRGILEDRPKTIKVKLLPGDNCDIDELLSELSGHGFIERYQVNGQRCIFIPKFAEHQHPHMKEQENGLPQPQTPGANPVHAPDKPGANPMQEQCKHPINREESLLPHMESLKSVSIETEVAMPPKSIKPDPKPKRSKPLLVDLPDDFAVTEEMRQWARDRKHLSDAEIDQRSDRFLNYVGKYGKQYVNWTAAWKDSMGWERAGPPIAELNGQSARRTGGAAAGGMTPQELDAYAAELERQGQ